LREKRLALQQQLSRWLVDARKHFAEVDKATIEALLREREDITEQAKDLLKRIKAVQDESGQYTSLQPVLQSNLDHVKAKRRDFQPINRTTASLPEIEADKGELKKLTLILISLGCYCAINRGHRDDILDLVTRIGMTGDNMAEWEARTMDLVAAHWIRREDVTNELKDFTSQMASEEKELLERLMRDMH
jgi:hypothetical protein